MRKSLGKGWSWKEVPLEDKSAVILGPTGKPVQTTSSKHPIGFGKPGEKNV